MGLSCIWTCLHYVGRVSTLRRPRLLLDVSAPHGPDLHLDLSALQRPVLLLEVSTTWAWAASGQGTCSHYVGLDCSWMYPHHSGLSCIWTCLHYSGLRCIWTWLVYTSEAGTSTGFVYNTDASRCVYTLGPDLHLDCLIHRTSVVLLNELILIALLCV